MRYLILLLVILFPTPMVTEPLILKHDHVLSQDDNYIMLRTAVAWNHASTQIASASGYDTYIWDADTGQLLYKLPNNAPALGVRWSPNDTRLVAWSSSPYSCYRGCDIDEVRIWDTETSRVVLALSYDFHINDVIWTHDSSQILIAHDGGGERRDVSTGEILATYPREYGISRMMLNANETRLWALDRDGLVSFWDFDGTEPLTTLCHSIYSHLYTEVWNEGGSLFVGFDCDGEVKIYDAQTGDVHVSLLHEGFEVYNAIWNGQRLLTWANAPEDSTHWRFWVWDATTGKALSTWDLTDLIYSASVNWNGQQAAVIAYSFLHIWDATTGDLLHTISYEGDNSSANDSIGITWNQDGSLIMSWMGWSSEGATTVWDTTTGEKVMDLVPMSFAAWSPDNEQVWGTDIYEQNILVWDLK